MNRTASASVVLAAALSVSPSALAAHAAKDYPGGDSHRECEGGVDSGQASQDTFRIEIDRSARSASGT